MNLDSFRDISVSAVSATQDVSSIIGGDAVVIGAKELSGWATINDSGIMPDSLLGARVRIQVDLTVSSVQAAIKNNFDLDDPYGYGAHATEMIINLVGNSADCIVKTFLVNDDPFIDGVDEVLAEETYEENVKDCHRFTGFMENPKEL